MAAISTPDRSKRTIDDIISPSEVPNPGDHVNSPNPVRRKGFVTGPIRTSDPPIKHLDTDSPVNVTDPVTVTDPPQAPVADLSMSDDIRCKEMADVIKAALSSPSVIKAISGAIIPSIVATLDSKLAPLQQQLHNISYNVNRQSVELNQLRQENATLKSKLVTAMEEMNHIKYDIDEQNQYS